MTLIAGAHTHFSADGPDGTCTIAARADPISNECTAAGFDSTRTHRQEQETAGRATQFWDFTRPGRVAGAWTERV